MKTYFSALFAALFISCNGSDLCTSVNCLNGSVCEDGTCQCTEQYEGPECATLWRQKIIGAFTGSGNCSQGNEFISIAASTSNPARIEFDNGFFGLMVGPLQISIPQQTYTDTGTGQNRTVSGSGAYEPGPLTLSLNLIVSGNSCSYQLHKQ